MTRRRGNNEGSIYKRKDGRWEARISLDHGGRKGLYGKTRQEVARKLAVAIKARQDGLPPVSERQTVRQYMGHWLESTRPSLRPKTWLRYEQLLRLHVVPEIGNLRLVRLSPQHLQRLYASRLEAGLSPPSVVQLHAVLRRALGQAARWGLVARNVVSLVTPPRLERREMATLSPDQVRSLLEAAAGDRLAALYVLAITTGLRQGEILALRWRDVDLDDGRTLQVRATLQRTAEGFVFAEPKTAHSRRQVALGTAAVEGLRRHRARQLEERIRLGTAWEDDDLVFANEVGRPIEASNLRNRSFWPLLERAGLPRIRFHDLRHTAATLLLGQGVHPKIVSEMLGHCQIAITLDLYSHVTPTMQRQAAETMDAVLSR